MTKWLTQRVEEVPEGAIVHFLPDFELRHKGALIFSHSNCCGTFGTSIVHTDNRAEVTCKRCLLVMQNSGMKIHAAD